VETSTIKVLVRVRPLLGKKEPCVQIGADGQVVVAPPRSLRRGDDAHSFCFDHVAPPDASQHQVFAGVGQEACNALLDGFNAAIFTYGQTGSGKTYSMFGGDSNLPQLPRTDPDDNLSRGLIPRSLELIFLRLAEKTAGGCTVVCKATLIEIYNEQVIDLLGSEARPLQLRENPLTGNVFVEGARVVNVGNVHDTLKLVAAGAARRTVAATGCNDTSSRSHCIFTLHLEAEETVADVRVVRTSCLHLVDLAGSERQQKAKSVGVRLKEASNINRSLSVFGNVILHLAMGHKHVPYRDSKFTF